MYLNMSSMLLIPECVNFCLGMHEGYLRLDPVHVQLVPKSGSLFYPSFSGPRRLNHPTSALVLTTNVAFDGFVVLILSSLVPGEKLNLDGKYLRIEKSLQDRCTLSHFCSKELQRLLPHLLLVSSCPGLLLLLLLPLPCLPPLPPPLSSLQTFLHRSQIHLLQPRTQTHCALK